MSEDANLIFAMEEQPRNDPKLKAFSTKSKTLDILIQQMLEPDRRSLLEDSYGSAALGLPKGSGTTRSKVTTNLPFGFSMGTDPETLGRGCGHPKSLKS